MPRGDKSKYTEKQKRQAKHIEQGYIEKGVSKDEAAKRAWATVNEIHGGGRKGNARGNPINKEPMRKGARHAAENRKKRSEAARKGWETRRRHHASST